MYDPEYTTRAPHFLRRSTPTKGAGLFSTLSTLWRNTIEAVKSAHGLDVAQPLPTYVLFAKHDVVCVHKEKVKFRIEPFCNYNNIEPTDLYIPVLDKEHIGLKRDVLENLLSQAAHILAAKSGSHSQVGYAKALLNDFKFLPHHPAPQEIKPVAVQDQDCPYIVPPPWERNLN